MRIAIFSNLIHTAPYVKNVPIAVNGFLLIKTTTVSGIMIIYLRGRNMEELWFLSAEIVMAQSTIRV